MSLREHETTFDALGSYALGALPEAETAVAAAHLEQCSVCADELMTLQAVVDQLPSTLAVAAPPAALRTRIMAQVESESELMRAASGERADRPERARWFERFAPGPLSLAAACAFLVLAGFFFGNTRHNGAGSQRTVAAVIDRDRAPGAKASLVRKGNDVRLVVRNFPKPPGGRVYQVWLQRRDHRAPTPTDSLFTVNAHGSGHVAVSGNLHGVRQVLVTAEPPGGSSVPSQLVPLLRAPVS